MDFDEIKNLIEIDGGKFIIVENGKPELVIVSFDEYKKRLIEKKGTPVIIPRVPKPVPKELESEELRLEDLPL